MIRLAALALLALLAVGCGAPATPAGPTPRPTPARMAPICADELRPLMAALEDLNARLSVGLTPAQYSERVGDVSVAYSRLDATQLAAFGTECINTAVLLEDAFNEYVTANNKWSECIRNTSCSMDRERPKLQAHWSTATDKISEARVKFP